ATMVLGYREGYLRPSKLARRLLARSSLGSWLAFGILCIVIGVIWGVNISVGWIKSDFGMLNEMRGLIAALTTIVIGVQISFGGFLLSVVAGNKMKHAVTT